jgi:hypothetical protein
MQITKQNSLLYIALAAPILMIAIVAASIYLPNLFNKPQYDFIFADGHNYKYSVDNNGKLQKDINPANVPPVPYPPIYKPQNVTNNKALPLPALDKIYYYDIKKGIASEIDFAQAQSYKLNNNLESPDGYSIENGGRNSSSAPFLFYSSTDYSAYYLVGHGIHKKLNIPQMPNSYYYPQQINFIGWILK